MKKKFWKLLVLRVSSQNSGARSQASRPPMDRSKIKAAARRFLTGRPANAVISTFISHEFSGGPWTSAVQGEIILKLSFGLGGGRNWWILGRVAGHRNPNRHPTFLSIQPRDRQSHRAGSHSPCQSLPGRALSSGCAAGKSAPGGQLQCDQFQSNNCPG